MNRRSLTVSFAIGLLALASPARAAEPPAPYRLTNGLTVILRPVAPAKDVAVTLLYSLGGNHDPTGKSGQAHLLEHLYCTAAAGEAPARDFAAIRERYPAGFNQQTGADYTVFAGLVPAAQLEAELVDVASRMSKLRIQDSDLEREVPRVVEELRNMYGGIPTLAGINHLRAQLHPLPADGRHGGQEDQVQSLTRDDLEQVWKDYYKPTNAVLVVAGGFDMDQIKSLISQHLGLIPAGQPVAQQAALQSRGSSKVARIQVKPPTPDATGVACLGVAAPAPGDPTYPAFLLAVSRLWTLSQTAFKPGQPQPVYFPVLDDGSTLAIQAGWSADQTPEAMLKDLGDRLDQAVKPPIRPQERQHAIQAMAILGTVEVADAMWARNLYGLAFSVGRRHQLHLDGPALGTAIQKVTDADLQALGKGVLAPEKRVSVIVEPKP